MNDGVVGSEIVGSKFSYGLSVWKFPTFLFCLFWGVLK